MINKIKNLFRNHLFDNLSIRQKLFHLLKNTKVILFVSVFLIAATAYAGFSYFKNNESLNQETENLNQAKKVETLIIDTEKKCLVL